jgi:methionine sulfoxide reductase heme-binding subunit
MPTMGTASAATGVICMTLLTAAVVFGILVNRHGRLPGLPRFAGLSTHRFLSLLALGFLALHILTAVYAPYSKVRLIAAVIPFAAGYQRAWLGLGAVACDLMLALIATSLLRRHIGRRTWRAVHWLAYACWPAALAHSIGIGAGLRSGRLLDLAVACILAVLVAAGWRVAGTVRAALRQRVPGQRSSARSDQEPVPARPRVLRTLPPVSGRPARAAAWRAPKQLRVDPVACTGHGLCAELLPELIALDQWGYPLLADQPVPAWLAGRAIRAVTDCPALALRLADPDAAVGGPAGQPSATASAERGTPDA